MKKHYKKENETDRKNYNWDEFCVKETKLI